jgi:hypothetical protein
MPKGTTMNENEEVLAFSLVFAKLNINRYKVDSILMVDNLDN